MLTVELRNKLKDLPYAWSHNITDEYPGLGFMYAFIASIVDPPVCVCIGSGSGIVPIIMSKYCRGKVILIDALNDVNGNSDETKLYYEKLKSEYPNIEIIIKDSKDTVNDVPDTIGYLHIDGDHSYEGVKSDWELYSSKVVGDGYVSIHDTDLSVLESYDWFEQENNWNGGPPRLMEELKSDDNWGIINVFDGKSTGLTILNKKFTNQNLTF